MPLVLNRREGSNVLALYCLDYFSLIIRFISKYFFTEYRDATSKDGTTTPVAELLNNNFLLKHISTLLIQIPTYLFRIPRLNIFSPTTTNVSQDERFHLVNPCVGLYNPL